MDSELLCLNCPLEDCYPHNPDCLVYGGGLTPAQRYYRKMRKNPEWHKKHVARAIAYKKTPRGRELATLSSKSSIFPRPPIFSFFE